jgi:hypothetical protein
MKELIKHLLREGILLEIDWGKNLSDVSKKAMTHDETKVYLKSVIGKCQMKPQDREKLALDKPYVHNKKIPTFDDGEIDLESFITNITASPKEILSQNAKMDKSSDENTISLNIGIPALRGLVYDIDENMFYIINTCPGAGSCAIICYARRGSYVLFPEVFVKQTRVLNMLLNHPKMFEKVLKIELEAFCLKNPNKEIKMRWNDAGDFFTKTYFEIASRITKTLQSEGYNIKSYAYTKMGGLMNLDTNLTLNFSDDANKKQTGMVKDLGGAKKSVIVDKKVFNDLLVKDAKGKHYQVTDKGKVIFKNGDGGIKELKVRLGKIYNVDPSTIVTYDELKRIPEGDKIYNVIVMPKGDGDIGAQRSDVKLSFLLYH